MLGSIYIGMSGMDAFSKGLQTISNNVANLDTAGFKATTVTFEDLYNNGGNGLSYSGGPSPEQLGDGVRIGQPQIDFSQGTLTQTSGALDLAIQGSGFLVLQDGSNTYYTRTGQFAVDNSGYISLQGTTHHLSVLNASNQAVALNIDAKRTYAPTETSTVTFANNLSSDASNTSATVSSITVYDSNGGKHTWQVTLKPVSATPGQWTVGVTDETGAIVGNDPAGTTPYTISFNGNQIDTTADKVTVVTTPTGAKQQSVVLDFSAITFFAQGPTNTLSATADGNPMGTLTGVTIDQSGQVQLAYSNGKTQSAGAVALADFRDPQQLTQIGNGLFQYNSTGQYRLLQSAQEGVGTLVSKQIEASNVNLSQEFGDLILVQRGFQASSQVVSVANDMIQSLFGMRGQ
jgi:flagellar hook protein FlgE